LTTKPEIKELLTAFGKERLSQRATQAAAWHLANGLTWEQLANKRIEHLNGASESWFNAEEIRAAMRIAQFAEVQAEQNATKNPGQGGSLNESASTVD
jgi:hypothetical protein